MPQFVVQNREIFLVSYLVEADSKEEAIEKWLNTEDYKELEDTTYLCDLAALVEADLKVVEVQ